MEVAPARDSESPVTAGVLVLNTGSSSLKWTVLRADRTVKGSGNEPWAAEDAASRVDQIRAALGRAPTFYDCLVEVEAAGAV